LVQKISWRDRFGNLFSVRLVMRILCGVDDGLKQRLERVGILFSEFSTRGKGAARVSGPDVFAQHENEPGSFMYGSLVKWIRRQVTIDVSCL
jgi:hypothetical protein